MNNKRKIYIDKCGQLWLGEKVSINPLLILLLVTAYLGKYFTFFLISWVIAAVHEITHIMVGKRLGIEFSGISVQPFGMCARLKKPIIKSPTREIITALSGPICNFVIFLCCLLIKEYSEKEYLDYTIFASASMGVINLLPCLPLDGGRVLRAILTIGSDAISAYQTTMRISRVVSLIILSVGVYLLLTATFQFSLILIGVFLVGNLCTEQKNISHQTLREILYCKEKLEPDKLNNASLLVANQSLPARVILRKLSYHKFYIVEVLDKNKNVVAHLTESRILESVLNNSVRITLGDIINQE